jgi:glycosyltransferase involved in cell wall biosynthesis
VKLAYVHRTQGNGAEGVHIAEMCRAFERLGFAVTVSSPQEESRSSRPGSVGRATLRQRFFRLISRWAPALLFELLELAYNVPAGWRIERLLRGGAVVLYERYAIFAFAAARTASRKGVPLILEVNYLSGSPLVRRKSKVLAPLARRIERYVVSKATVVAAISVPIGEQLQREHGVAPDRIVLTPNAANPEFFHPGVAPVRSVAGVRIDTGSVVGFVGTFAPWHGLDLLVQAFGRAAAQFDAARLLLVGDGPERSRIEQLVAQGGLTGKVVFAGTVPYEELPRYVAAFTMGVMPDSNEYGSPVKIFEYMACGKPVVVPDYAPLREVVAHRMQGLIFRRTDIDALTGCIEELLRDPALARELGARGRDLVVKDRNWTNNAQAVLAKVGRA